jgi:SsrA-binding protein
MYFKKGRAKVEIGIARGKKKGDKRQAVKSRESDREIQRALRK